MTFAEKLNKLATQREMDRATVVKRVKALGVEVHPNTLGNYFNGGTRPPGLDVALALSKVLGAPLEYLADDSLDELPTREPDSLSEVETMILRACRDSKLDGYEILRLLFEKGKEG